MSRGVDLSVLVCQKSAGSRPTEELVEGGYAD